MCTGTQAVDTQSVHIGTDLMNNLDDPQIQIYVTPSQELLCLWCYDLNPGPCIC